MTDEKTEKKKRGFFSKLWSEIKSITVWNIFIFLVTALPLFLISRYLIWRFVLGSPSPASCGLRYFEPLSSCPASFISSIKFYDLPSYLSVYVKHGVFLMQGFYFLIVPIGIYLLLTTFVWKKPSTLMKIASLAIGIFVAVLIFLLLPSSPLCTFDIPVIMPGAASYY